jgi:site-specific DNA-cytosine methylase
MRVLVACEFSGRVREAFRKRGHDAWSVDLEDTDIPGQHIKADIQNVPYGFIQSFDLMIAHPPCTYLANSGERWIKEKPGRIEQRREAVNFVKWLASFDLPAIAIENPIGHLSTAWRKPDQIIQPFHFGHPDWKSTCLWLKNLPPLMATNHCVPEEKLGGGKKPGRVSSKLHRLPPSPERAKLRSITYQGIADAMAEQWGKAA